MKFSVLMSVYYNDRSDFLKEALDSIANQSLKADQIIIVQDGELPKDLASVLASFKLENDVTHVLIEKNGGLGNALDLGLKASRNEWVLRMDADDISVLSRFKTQVDFIKKNPDYDCIGGWQEEFNIEPHDLKKFRRVPIENTDILNGMKKFSPVNHVTVALRKSAVISCGSYRGGIGFHEDYDLWNRLKAKGFKFYNIPTVLVNVRVGFGMLGRRGGWSYYKNECNCHIEAYHLGILSFPRLLLNIALRLPVRLSPIPLRAFIYKFARKVVNNN